MFRSVEPSRRRVEGQSLRVRSQLTLSRKYVSVGCGNARLINATGYITCEIPRNGAEIAQTRVSSAAFILQKRAAFTGGSRVEIVLYETLQSMYVALLLTAHVTS